MKIIFFIEKLFLSKLLTISTNLCVLCIKYKEPIGFKSLLALEINSLKVNFISYLDMGYPVTRFVELSELFE